MSNSKRVTAFGLALAGSLLLASEARAESTICTVITQAQIPRIINASGNYCLTTNLATPSTTGAAITITAGSVTLDLNGFRLGGAAAGPGTQAIGIFADNRSNVTIKNGGIRGFYKAIHFEETGAPGTSKANVLEDLRVDQNRFAGIHVKGTGNIIRNVQVVDTGGSTVASIDNAYGIMLDGPANRVLNSDVSETTPEAAGSSYAIHVSNGNGSVLEGNRLGNGSLLANTYAVHIVSGDVQIIGLRMTTFATGILYSGSGRYRDNLASGVTDPYPTGGGTDSGNNQ